MKYVWFVISIIPMPFFLNYIDIAKPHSYLPIITLLFYILITGYLSIKINLIMMVISTMISTVISLIVAPTYLIPPNESWFNPFTMNVCIILLGFFIFLMQLLVHAIVKLFVSYLKNRALHKVDNEKPINEHNNFKWLVCALIVGIGSFCAVFFIEGLIRSNRQIGLIGLTISFCFIVFSFYSLIKFTKEKTDIIVSIIVGIVPFLALLANGLILIVWYLPK